MKQFATALFVLGVLGCQVPEEGNKAAATLTADVPAEEAELPTATPTPTPSPTYTSTRPFLSAWVRPDPYIQQNVGWYQSVNLSVLTDEDAGSGVQVTYGTVQFVINSATICYSHVDIVGSNDNGTLVVTASNGGNVNINNAYCNSIKGPYEYAAMAVGQYRLCTTAGIRRCHTLE